MKNATKENSKFYQRTWFTILMLIVFFPVGLYLMWKYNKFPFVVRVVVSVFFGLMVVSSIFDSLSNEDLYNKIKELEDKNKKLEEENEKLEKENEKLEKETILSTENIKETEGVVLETYQNIEEISIDAVQQENQVDSAFYELFLSNPDNYIGKEIETTIIVSSCVNMKKEYYISSEMDANRNALKVYTDTENNIDSGEYITVCGTFKKENEEYILSDGRIIQTGNSAKDNWEREFSDYISYFKENADYVSYDDLMRYPESYRYKMIAVQVKVEKVETDGVLFEGKIKAQMEGKDLLINDGREVREPRIQEGDSFMAYGFGKGLATVKVKNGSGMFSDTVNKYNIPEISLRYME